MGPGLVLPPAAGAAALLVTAQPAIEKLARLTTQLALAGEPAQPLYGDVKLSQTKVPVMVAPPVPYLQSAILPDFDGAAGVGCGPEAPFQSMHRLPSHLQIG